MSRFGPSHLVLCLAAGLGCGVLPAATLRHHWNFDEGAGGVVADSVGDADLSIRGNAVGWTSGRDGGAFAFDGSSFAQTDRNDDVANPVGGVAVAGWFRTAANTENRSFLFQFEREYEMRIRNGGLQVSFAGSIASAPTWSGDLDEGLWHHFVAQNDGATTQLYIDGELLGSRGESLGSLTLESKPSALAAKQNGQRPFAGTLDDFRYYAGTLTLPEIRALAQVGDRPPTAREDAYSGASGTPLVVAAPGVLANDTETDGDAVSAVLVADVGQGSLMLNADGGFVYDPPVGFSGVVGFSYRAEDVDGASSVVSVTLTILDPATSLTPQEVAQIEGDLGIVLSEQEKLDLASIVKPQVFPGWRNEANQRIEAHRKADLSVEVVDAVGNPVPGAAVRLRMKRNRFNFGGVVTVMDQTDGAGNLSAAGSTTADWERLTKALFNALGCNNALKPRIVSQHEYLPAFFDWAAANALPVRGHLLLWPGTGDVEDMDAPGAVAGVDYGQHLTNAGTSDHASYDVAAAVEAYRTSARSRADKDALQAIVDAEIEEWAGQWNVSEWDVLNETLSNRLLTDILGEDRMAGWFQLAAAHRRSPSTRLFINEFQIASARFVTGSTSYQTRRDTYFERIDRLIADGAPLDGIGFQSRFRFLDEYDPAVVYARIDEFATRYPGLEIAGTEFEVKDDYSFTSGDLVQAYDEATRARVTEEVMTTYFSHDQVSGLSAWDFINPLPDGTPNAHSRALCYYGDGPGGVPGPQVKLNGLVWYYLHRIRYHTDVSGTTGADGKVGFRGFMGDYEVVVNHGGSDYAVSHALDADGGLQVVLDDVTVVADSVMLEHFEFEDPAGTALGGVAKAAGSAIFSGVTPNLATNGAGSLVVRQHPTLANQGQGDFLVGGPLEFGGRGSGRYELAFTIAAADLSGGDPNGASFGFGLRDGEVGLPVFLIRLNKTVGGLALSTFIDSTYTQIQSFSGQFVLEESLRIRSEIDLDAGTADIYLSTGNGAEEFKQQVALSAVATRWDQLYLAAQNNPTDWGADDVVEIAEMSVRKLDVDTYDAWVARTDWGGSSAVLPDEDADGDGWSNFLEFAFGRSPVAVDPAGPALQLVNTLQGRVLEVPLGVDSLDLNYMLQSSDDLADWTRMNAVRLHGEAGETLRLPVEIEGSGSGFFRVEVSPLR